LIEEDCLHEQKISKMIAGIADVGVMRKKKLTLKVLISIY